MSASSWPWVRKSPGKVWGSLTTWRDLSVGLLVAMGQEVIG